MLDNTLNQPLASVLSALLLYISSVTETKYRPYFVKRGKLTTLVLQENPRSGPAVNTKNALRGRISLNYLDCS
jgi:hypothetical protein